MGGGGGGECISDFSCKATKKETTMRNGRRWENNIKIPLEK
jgi:hypothetical protein